MIRVALMGKPLGHSLSPRLHAAAFNAQSLDWSYELVEVGAAELPGAVRRLRRPEWRGANVTLPHKVTVIELLDELDEAAEAIGAVNTIVARGSRLVGANTDAPGLLRDLERAGVEIRGRPALLLGAGGAARAAAWALASQGVHVTIVARRPEQGEDIARGLQQRAGLSAQVRAWEERAFSSAAEGSLILNATPVGMWPNVDGSPWPEDVDFPSRAAVYDLVYQPRETRLVAAACESGLQALGGLGMLVEQAALANEMWTELAAPRGAMRSAALATTEVS